MNTTEKTTGFEIRFHTSQERLEMPQNAINGQGQEIAQGLLRQWGLPTLPSDWVWEWKVNGKGEYIGNFPKRVGKYLHKQGVKLTADQLAQLGNEVAPHTEKQKSYCIDFTRRIDWDAGDFGDDGSCFWGCNDDARGLMEDAGIWAVRFYDDEGEGYARAFIYEGMGKVIVFNGYGLETLPIARILAHHWGAYYKQVDLCNQGCDDGTIYINGGSGYAIGAQEDIVNFYSHDLEIDDPNQSCCDCCGESICPDDAYYHNDQNLCEGCYSEHVVYCCKCNEDYDKDDCTNGPDGEWRCDQCHNETYIMCCDCDAEIEHDMAHAGPDDEWRCCVCNDEAVAYCANCDEYYLRDEMKECPDGTDRCESCYNDAYVACVDCKDVHPIDDMYTDPIGNHYCEPCFEAWVIICPDCKGMFHCDDLAPMQNICHYCATSDETVKGAPLAIA